MSSGRIQRVSATWGAGGILAVATVGMLWIVLAGFWVAPGVLTIDDFVYQAMIDAFARHGSLFVSNGFEEYGSQTLKLDFMRESNGHLAPQYPGGWGIVAAPAYLAGGLRGVIVLNALASAVSLPLIWLAARALFDDRRLATHAALIYGLATFAVDYALGVWPHGVTTCLVTAAVAAVATGWRGTPAAELRGALIAGLVLGLGINIRVEALFAVAPIGVWLLGAARRPYASFGLLLAGLVPGLAVAMVINYVKFGIPSPITYGTSMGGTSFGYYAALAPLAAAGALAALALGLAQVRAVLFRPAALVLAGACTLILLLALPGSRAVLSRLAEGFWILVVDFQALPAPAFGLTELEDGTTRMYGLAKKALLQSLPYAAAVLVLAPRLLRGPDRPPVAFCVLFILLGAIPFAYGSWHGGMANNMRYFLSLVPVLAILSAVVLRELAERSEGRTLFAPAAALVVVAVAFVYGAQRQYPLAFIAQHTLPNAIVGGIAGLSVVMLLARGGVRGTIATALRGLVVLGLVTAFCSAWVFDLYFNQWRRSITAEMARLTLEIPRNALVVVVQPSMAGFRLNRPPALTAKADYHTREINADHAALMTRVFAEARPVFAQSRSLADSMINRGAASSAEPVFGIDEGREFYRMAPPFGGGQDDPAR